MKNSQIKLLAVFGLVSTVFAAPSHAGSYTSNQAVADIQNTVKTYASGPVLRGLTADGLRCSVDFSQVAIPGLQDLAIVQLMVPSATPDLLQFAIAQGEEKSAFQPSDVSIQLLQKSPTALEISNDEAQYDADSARTMETSQIKFEIGDYKIKAVTITNDGVPYRCQMNWADQED